MNTSTHSTAGPAAVNDTPGDSPAELSAYGELVALFGRKKGGVV